MQLHSVPPAPQAPPHRKPHADPREPDDEDLVIPPELDPPPPGTPLPAGDETP